MLSRSRFGTMNPEFILLNINRIDMVGSNGFLIETKAEGNQFKTIFFEALDRKDAKQIVAKLNYLKYIIRNILVLIFK